MQYFPRFLSASDLRALCADALSAYDPRGNALDLSRSATVEAIRRRLEARLDRRLRYFGAFLLLVSETTIETANDNASEGWHTDGSCAAVDGVCHNAWIPLYNSARRSGLQVIAERDNAWVYAHLGDPSAPLEVFVRASAAHVFERLRAEADLLLLRRTLRRSLLLDWAELKVATCETPAPGDLALFRQTELHRGVHDDGIRLQLSLKFLDQDARDLRDPAAPAPAPKALSKHGRLEAQLVRELLSLQIAGAAAREPAPASVVAAADAQA